MLVVSSFTSFATLELQHQINRQWQMTAFGVSNSSGNGISETA
jgi:hypothetical protein